MPNTNSSSSLSSSPSAAPSPSAASTMEMQIDLPNSLITSSNAEPNVSSSTRCQSIHGHSEPGSDMDGSDMDSDSQLKVSNIRNSLNERFVGVKKIDNTENATITTLSNTQNGRFFERVRTDSTETDASIEFKSQPNMINNDTVQNNVLYNNEDMPTEAFETNSDKNTQILSQCPSSIATDMHNMSTNTDLLASTNDELTKTSKIDELQDVEKPTIDIEINDITAAVAPVKTNSI